MTSAMTTNLDRGVMPIKYENGQVMLIDQRLLPERIEWVDATGLAEMCEAIANMTVRGAPSIGVAALSGSPVNRCDWQISALGLRNFSPISIKHDNDCKTRALRRSTYAGQPMRFSTLSATHFAARAASLKHCTWYQKRRSSLPVKSWKITSRPIKY